MRLLVRVASVVSLASLVLYSSAAGQTPAPTLFRPSTAPVARVEAAGLDSTRPLLDFAQEQGPDRLRGALWGVGFGLVAGGLVGALTVLTDDVDYWGAGKVIATTEAAFSGAIIGAGVGAMVGATWLAPARRRGR